MNPSRHLYVAWRQPGVRRTFPVARLVRHESGGFEFAYVEGARDAVKFGFAPFLFAPSFDEVLRSDVLPAFFVNRLMSERRPDYVEWLRTMGLEADVDPFTIFSRSGGRRATDDFEIYAPPEREPSGVLVYRFFVRGISYVAGAEERVAQLRGGDRLDWRQESDNPVDSLAVSVHDGGESKIGFVPFVLSEDFRALTSSGVAVDLTAERINLAPTPTAHRLLARMDVRPPAEFRPFEGERHQPMGVSGSCRKHGVLAGLAG